MVENILVYLSIVIGLSTVLVIISRIIKQPPIIAYFFAGILAGPIFLGIVGSAEIAFMEISARIGVAFLLFIVGLSLDFRLFKEIGKVSVIAGVAEIAIVSIAGFFLLQYFGFSFLASVYLGIALAFSSTVVVVKILSDKKELETLHGKIALGILIVQDIVAAAFLMILPFSSKAGNIFYFAKEFGIGIAVIILVFIFSSLLFGRFMNYLAKSQEALFLFGIALALMLGIVFYKLGFSIEIGSLIAGMSLASSKYALDLSGKMKPLRDFFIILFFVFFGSKLAFPLNFEAIKTAIIISVFVIIFKPLVVMFILKAFKYTKRTNFLASISLAQVSEFSLILVLLGYSLGHLSPEAMNLTVWISLITIGLSAYGITYSHFLTQRFSGILNLFEGKIKNSRIKEDRKSKEGYDIILFGYHRIGYKLLGTIKKLSKNFVIVDYNPKVVLNLNSKGIKSIYGDAANKAFLNELALEKAKLVISTIPEEYANLTIEEALSEANSNAVFIATTEQPRAALDLYEAGIDYVIIPHHLGGDYAARILKEFKIDKEKFRQIGKIHKQELKEGKTRSTFD